MARSREQVAAVVDHTLLKPETTPTQVADLVAEATELGVYAVCVSPSMVPAAVNTAGLPVATVAGFPSGKHHSEIKAAEAARAVEAGADEVDMVLDVGAVLCGDLAAVAADIGMVRTAVPGAVLKVIVESAVLLGIGGEEALIGACRAAENAGADFVKTSTGFHPTGGASVRAVEVMAATVGGRLGVKASGGIRTAADAAALLDAGATRLGLSGTRAILDGFS
ncbi:deoxyribose-phosphate aldolase [Mycolicibacillus trivialis]|uniref:Deoxyribose-phosphate aldolase n=1 Tax=Mycolicibacillus trivialis TaxID=1798 RepID=A0A1X2EN91_9MYCO|nr:deoxyribose-phosphate aldolase [Mycolicibacillus trivialis]ORX07025.1 2-deoxyribose-5-phosphate aldolase [Mycolicibacillus trivialis]